MSIQSMESLLDYSNGFQPDEFQKIQKNLRQAMSDEDAWDAKKVTVADEVFAASDILQPIKDACITVDPAHPIQIVPRFSYNPESDSICVSFPAFEQETQAFLLSGEKDKYYQIGDLRDYGLELPAEKFAGMSYEDFQHFLEKGMGKCFEACLTYDETFQKMHPSISLKDPVEEYKEKFHLQDACRHGQIPVTSPQIAERYRQDGTAPNRREAFEFLQQTGFAEFEPGILLAYTDGHGFSGAHPISNMEVFTWDATKIPYSDSKEEKSAQAIMRDVYQLENAPMGDIQLDDTGKAAIHMQSEYQPEEFYVIPQSKMEALLLHPNMHWELSRKDYDTFFHDELDWAGTKTHETQDSGINRYLVEDLMDKAPREMVLPAVQAALLKCQNGEMHQESMQFFHDFCEKPRYLFACPNYDDKLHMIAGFHDTTSRDAWCPCISKAIGDTTVTVYEDFKDKERREPCCDTKRFAVYLEKPGGFRKRLASTNSWMETRKVAQEAVKNLSKDSPSR